MKQSALGGRRVLAIADATGVYCGKLLADLGAEVIRLEPPGGDATRRIAPFPAGAGTDDPGFFHCYMNAGKKSLTLDPDTAAGRSLLLDLAATADLIVETLPPGRLAQLGLGFEQLRAVNPALVLTSITPFGQSGPHRDYPGADIVAMAMGGAMVVLSLIHISEPTRPY